MKIIKTPPKTNGIIKPKPKPCSVCGKEKIEEIYIGYKNLLLYKLGRFEEEDCVDYKRKKAICNQSCPLNSKLLGISYCDPRKEMDGENGCGCIIEAKLWSDSPCPLNKF